MQQALVLLHSPARKYSTPIPIELLWSFLSLFALAMWIFEGKLIRVKLMETHIVFMQRTQRCFEGFVSW